MLLGRDCDCRSDKVVAAQMHFSLAPLLCNWLTASFIFLLLQDFVFQIFVLFQNQNDTNRITQRKYCNNT